MTTLCATHSGPFHADDVLAWALLTVFRYPDAELVRTRDAAVLRGADIVFDVGGSFDEATGRFDHHQQSYQGPLSSAGMVLNWLESQGSIDAEVATELRNQLVDYVDAVDNGRVVPNPKVPCFARIVEAHTQGNETLADFDAAFHRAAQVAKGTVKGIAAGIEQVRAAEAAVLGAMSDAVEAGRAVIFLDAYNKWKPVYYANGGDEHPTDYLLFPGLEGTWRIVAIAPCLDSFDQKRPLPLEWAGLTGSSLEKVTGVPGSIFCHKNRFIAVFKTREAAVEALEKHGLMHRPADARLSS
ncbi:MAG: MYG1 family protein [Myxococcota bacterium]